MGKKKSSSVDNEYRPGTSSEEEEDDDDEDFDLPYLTVNTRLQRRGQSDNSETPDRHRRSSANGSREKQVSSKGRDRVKRDQTVQEATPTQSKRRAARKGATPKRNKGRTSGSAPRKNDDDDRSTQLFSTEFISAMRVDDSVHLTDFKRIVDPWRNRYNDPIQVPSMSKPAPVKAAPQRVQPTYILEPFERPNTYIRYIESQDKAGIYDLDTEDEIWRKLYNERYKPEGQEIAHHHMERAIFEFEKAAYNGLTKAGGRSGCHGLEYDENTVCDVCQLPDSEEGNEMVFCDGCNLCVHQVCYGIKVIPEGNWYCCACQLGAVHLSCCLCSGKGGALKPCTDGVNFAHLRCAMWIPESSIVDTDLMEPVDISNVPIDRFKLLCSLCGQRKGACMQCCVSSCTTAFHVSCATSAQLRMELEVEDDAVFRQAYCNRHRNASSRRPHAQRISAIWRGSTTDDSQASHHNFTVTEFSTYVKPEAVADELRIPQSMIHAIFAYWVQKRRRQHGKPLLRQFVPAVVSRAASIYGDAQTVKRQVHAMRQNLEKARSLCELVRRREVKKKELLSLFEQEFVTSLQEACASTQQDLKSFCGLAYDWISSHKQDSSQASAAPAQATGPPDNEALSAELVKEVERLQKHPLAAPFLFPVNHDMYPDYHAIIKTPMDLATLHSRASSHTYSTYEDFIKDSELIFDNCATYNQPHSDIVRASEQLRETFYEWARTVAPSAVPSRSPGGVHTPSSSKKKSQPPASGRKVLICPTCGRQFVYPATLRRHIQQHEEEASKAAAKRKSASPAPSKRSKPT
eukprot:m.27428 g.27428  ORF g.27428 m.27428 type:complete len:801 (-) comp10246_c1_seq1:186-2588(-)